VRFRIAAALVAAGVLLATAGDAGAYCRTTTAQIPAGYDPAVYGCWQEGTPVAWTAGRVGYSLDSAGSRQVSLADATRAAHQAFGAWNSAPCEGGKPNVQAFDNGPVTSTAAADDCGLDKCDPTYHDPQHVIVFRDDGWPYDDNTNTLALTTVTYGIDSAEIFDADIEINSAQHKLTVQEPPPYGVYDLQAILTHEAGHFFGLAHATSTSSIMYAFYKSGAVSLSPDDVDGACTVYSPLNTSPDGVACACDVVGSGRRGTAGAAACVLALLGLLTYRSRRRLARSTRRTR
jgi:hypothetical protein